MRAVTCGFAKPLGQHREKSGRALLRFGLGCRQVRSGFAGNRARLNLQRLHNGLQRFAHLGGRGIARSRSLLEARRNHAFQFRGNIGNDLAQVNGIGKLDGANGLEVFAIRTRKRMTAAG